MSQEKIIEKLREKAAEYAKTHATRNAKSFYVLGKKDAAATFLNMVRSDGIEAVEDVAHELLKFDPENQDAKWILGNGEIWKNR